MCGEKCEDEGYVWSVNERSGRMRQCVSEV